MATVTLQNAMETLDNLNNTTQTMSDTVNEPGNSDGLYIMINKMISDLAAIKIAIKAEERKIQTDITAHIKTKGYDPATNDISAAETITATNFTVSTKCLTGGSGSGTNRHESAQTTSNKLPAVYKATKGSSTVAYSETAVFGVLAKAAGIIRTLKNGDIDNTDGTDYNVA